MRTRFAVAFPALLLLAVTAAAQMTDEGALKAKQYQRALDFDEGLIQQMLEKLGPGEEQTRLFATVVARKAIALSGLGRDEDAQWYWDVARGISPDVEKIDLTQYGTAGEGLRPLLVDVSSAPRRVGGEVKAPVAMKRVEPQYPEAARKARVSGIVIVESVIDQTGIVRSVRILKSLPAPTLAYAAAEALRQWRFIPGKMNGEPVKVLFNLTINFRLTSEKDESKP